MIFKCVVAGLQVHRFYPRTSEKIASHALWTCPKAKALVLR